MHPVSSFLPQSSKQKGQPQQQSPLPSFHELFGNVLNVRPQVAGVKRNISAVYTDATPPTQANLKIPKIIFFLSSRHEKEGLPSAWANFCYALLFLKLERRTEALDLLKNCGASLTDTPLKALIEKILKENGSPVGDATVPSSLEKYLKNDCISLYFERLADLFNAESAWYKFFILVWMFGRNDKETENFLENNRDFLIGSEETRLPTALVYCHFLICNAKYDSVLSLLKIFIQYFKASPNPQGYLSFLFYNLAGSLKEKTSNLNKKELINLNNLCKFYSFEIGCTLTTGDRKKEAFDRGFHLNQQIQQLINGPTKPLPITNENEDRQLDLLREINRNFLNSYVNAQVIVTNFTLDEECFYGRLLKTSKLKKEWASRKFYAEELTAELEEIKSSEKFKAYSPLYQYYFLGTFYLMIDKPKPAITFLKAAKENLDPLTDLETSGLVYLNLMVAHLQCEEIRQVKKLMSEFPSFAKGKDYLEYFKDLIIPGH